MKKIISLAALAVSTSILINGLSSTSAHAQAVTSGVEIEVSVPDIVFLQTYDKITFNLEAADLTTATDLLDNATPGSAAAGSSTVGTLPPQPVTTTGKTTKTYADVLLYRTWGLGGATGQIEHGISSVSNTLTLTGGAGAASTITMDSPIASALTKDNAPGIDGTAIEGMFDFTFDFSGVKRSGLHTGGVVTVSAEGV